MEKDHVTQFMSIHGNKFATENHPMIKRRIEALPDERFDEICAINYKSPTTALIFSILLGPFGVDRFYLGEIGKGILKLFTLGFCFIGLILDILSAQKRAHAYNLRLLEMTLEKKSAMKIMW